MTKSDPNRQPSTQTNPKTHLINYSSPFKNSRKPIHASPLSVVYAPSTLVQHASQVEDSVCKQPSEERNTDTQSKKNLTWTCDMDDYLLDCLLDQTQKGQQIDGHFTKAAYITVAHLVTEKFCITCNSDNIKHRLKTLKKKYFAAKEILSCSGFCFNQSTCLIEASASTWDSYIRVHPWASPYRFKQIQQWEKMDMVYGSDLSPGEHVDLAPEEHVDLIPEEHVDLVPGEHVIMSNERVGLSNNEENNIGGSNEQNGNDENTTDVNPEPTSSTSKLKVHEESSNGVKIVNLLTEELSLFREAITKVVEAINHRNYTERELFDKIQKIKGMSAKNKMKAYQSLSEDVNLGRGFIGCSEEMHGLWMSTKFGDDIFDLF